MCGFIAQLVEHRTGIAEVMGSSPIEALIFLGFFFLSNCLNWKIYCDDHTSLSKQHALINHEIAQKQSLYNDLSTESRKNTFRMCKTTEKWHFIS